MNSSGSSRENKKIKAVIICGPTGSGKSAVGMEIARKYNGSIVSADSRQIYRRLDIGTAKPSKQDMAEIPHYEVDIADVGDEYTAVKFARDAADSIELIAADRRIPIVVGGAGLYLEALTEGIFIGPGKDDNIRSELKMIAQNDGLPALYGELQRIDPDTALSISANDEVRIIRALEIHRQTGEIPSKLRNSGEYPSHDFDFLWLALDLPRDILYERIDKRVEKMLAEGLIDEVKALTESELGGHIRRKKIVGYYEIMDYLDGKTDLSTAVGLVKQHSRNYAKRQMTWFRNRSNPNWLNPNDVDFYYKVYGLLDEYLKSA